MSWPVGTLVMVVAEHPECPPVWHHIGRVGTVAYPYGEHCAIQLDMSVGFVEGYVVHIPGTGGAPSSLPDHWIYQQWQLRKIGGPDVDTTEPESIPKPNLIEV